MNRTLLWVTLLFVAFVVAFPAIQLILDSRPAGEAVKDFFRAGIDLQGGTRLLYNVEYQGKTLDMDQVVNVLKTRIDPTGTRNYVIKRVGGQRLEILMAGADDREVSTVQNLVTRNGYLTFRICVDPADVPTYSNIAEDRLKGVAPPPQYEWIPLQYNSKLHWDRVRDFLFWSPADQGISRQDALHRHNGAKVIYVIHETTGSGFIDVRTGVLGAEAEPAEAPPVETPAEAEGEAPVAETGTDASAPAPDAAKAEAAADKKGVEVSDVEVLVLKNIPRVEGRDFAGTRKDSRDGAPIIVFSMKSDADAQNRLAEITGNYIEKRMGIVLDDKMQSAPNIRSQLRVGGEISGYSAGEERDAVLTVLQSGVLDVQLRSLSKGSVGPELGADNIRRGLMASLVSLICVLVFMAGYYLFAGLIADLAVLINLLIVILIMHWMHGTWTLPGIAGLILTVGMSVDANVLIFERIREELSRGSSIRLAVRNGYSRAMPAIIDGNLTTFFTAVILAWVGSHEVQGFAVVLIIGLAASMFTALLFTRAVFEFLIQAGMLRKLPMLRLIKSPNIRFSRIARGAFWVSMVLVAAGFALAFTSGDDKYAMEFRGGTQVEFELREPRSIEWVREQVASLDDGYLMDFDLPATAELDSVRQKVRALGDEFANAIVTVADAGEVKELSSRFNVQLFAADLDKARQALRTGLGAVRVGEPERVVDQGFGYSKAVVQHMEYKSDKQADIRYVAQVLSTDDEMVRQTLMAKFGDLIKRGRELDVEITSRILSVDDVLDMQGVVGAEPSPGPGSGENPAASDSPAADAGAVASETAPPAEAPKDAESAAGDESKTEVAEDKADDAVVPVVARPILKDYKKFVGAYEATLQLVGESIPIDKARSWIDDYLQQRERDKARIQRDIGPLAPDPEHPGQFASFRVYVYDRRFDSVDEAQVRRIQAEWDRALADAIADPPPLNSDKIDRRIADESWHQALIAIGFSLVVIVAYVWFRFARISYGLAAVVALVHDVSIALGLVILFSWLGKNIPFIGEMKIDLPMIGAFLTLIGYSLNDTIVVFDRIRENRGKFGELSESVVNNSINQTLSRTVLTSFTTWIVVVILYFFGGVQSSVHGFAFVLSAGVIVGTYSSVFIASPLLLWLRKTRRRVGITA